MRISASDIVFSPGKIIDVHMHVGNWVNNRYSARMLDEFIKQPLSNGDVVEKVIVSNLSGIYKEGMLDETNANIELLNIAKNNPKIAPLAVCQPKTGSVDNIKKLFQENPGKFVGLKFHPDGHEIMASNNLFNPYLKFAQEKKLPCLFHCGIPWENGKLVSESVQYSSPEQIYTAAKKFPKTPVILAHLGAGGEKVHSKAMKVLFESIDKKDANLFVDISWVDIDDVNKPTIVELIRKLKTKKSLNRILFGSDAPIGEFFTGKNCLTGKEFYEKTITDIKLAIRRNFKQDADEITNKVFYENANKLFFKRHNTGKIIAVAAALSAAVTAFAVYLTKANDDKKQSNKLNLMF